RERAANRRRLPGDLPIREDVNAGHRRRDGPGCLWEAEQAAPAARGSRCSPRPLSPGVSPHAVEKGCRMKRLVEEVFVTEGVPQFTFVAPPNFTEILLDIRRPGKPVVIEGQSGTGKTTCVKKILERLGEGASASTTYLTARDAAHVFAIARVAQTPVAGTFVIVRWST